MGSLSTFEEQKMAVPDDEDEAFFIGFECSEDYVDGNEDDSTDEKANEN